MNWLDVDCHGRHRWAWVPTWGVIGFEECQDCGITRAYGERPSGSVLADVPASTEIREAEPAAPPLPPLPSAPKRRMTPAERAARDSALLAMHATGKFTLRQIGEKFGIHLSCVCYHVARHRKLAEATGCAE